MCYLPEDNGNTIYYKQSLIKKREKERPTILINGYLLSIASKIFLLVINSEILFIAYAAHNNTGTDPLDILIHELDFNTPFFIPITLE